MIRLERRPTPSRAWAIGTPLLAVVLTMVAGAIMFGLLAPTDPALSEARAAGDLGWLRFAGLATADAARAGAEAIRVIFWDPICEPILGLPCDERFAAFSRPQLLVKAGPLILIAIGLSLGFRAGIWNIGAEGQYIVGAICGAAFGLAFWPGDSALVFPGMVLAGILGGILWAMIPALLKVYANTNEILVSLLLVYVAEALLASAATGWLRNPEGQGFPGSRNLGRNPGTDNPELIAGTGMHWGVLAAFVAVIAAQVLFQKHQLGYQIRLAGQAPRAARFAGVDPGRLVILCLGISGALAGAAGLFEVAGPQGTISIDFNAGYGFTAIIVAFLGRLNPIGILFAGLLMALTYIGGELAQLILRVPGPAIQAFQGMLLFFLLALDVLSNYRIRLGRTDRAGRVA